MNISDETRNRCMFDIFFVLPQNRTITNTNAHLHGMIVAEPGTGVEQYLLGLCNTHV